MPNGRDPPATAPPVPWAAAARSAPPNCWESWGAGVTITRPGFPTALVPLRCQTLRLRRWQHSGCQQLGQPFRAPHAPLPSVSPRHGAGQDVSAGQGWGWTPSLWDSAQCWWPAQPHKIPYLPVAHWAAPTWPKHGTDGPWGHAGTSGWALGGFFLGTAPLRVAHPQAHVPGGNPVPAPLRAAFGAELWFAESFGAKQGFLTSLLVSSAAPSL